MTPEMTEPNINYQLGAILAEVKNLKEDFRRSEDKSDLSRSAVHRRMDELVARVGSLETTLQATKSEVAEMKPVTDDVKKWKLMGIGALGVVGIGGTAMGVMLAGVLEKMAHFLKGAG